MIEVSTTHAFLIYLGFSLTVVLGIWSYHHYTTKDKRLLLNEEELRACEYCQTAYLAEVGKSLSRCPCCRSYNDIPKHIQKLDL